MSVGGSTTVALITWTDDLAIGIIEVDEQHRRLVDLLNRAHEAMKRGGKPQFLKSIVDELVAYTIYHFAREEKLMEQAAYPELEEHRRKHQAMAAKVAEYRKEIEGGAPTVAIRFMQFLRQWLTNHILQTDKRYGPYLKGVALRSD